MPILTAAAAEKQDKELKQQPTEGTNFKRNLKRKRGRPSKKSVQNSQGVRELNGSGNATKKNALEVQRLAKVALRAPGAADSTVRELNGSGNATKKKALEVQRLDKVALRAPGVADCAGDSTDSQDASGRHTAEVPGTRSIPNEAARILRKASHNTDDDDRPLSTLVQNPANMDELNWSDEQVKLARESTPVDSISDTVPNGSQVIPFVKSSPIWKTVESLDVFRTIPQNPHFCPLVKCKEEYREGFAIGNMVTFSTLVEKISSLHFDDPRPVFDSILESLVDLEKYGFNVTILQGRVDELLSIKRRQGQFQGEAKEAKSTIVEQTLEISKLEEVADNIEKEITELKEKHGLIKAEIAAKETKIASLQLSVDSMNENIKNARSDFEKAALAPFT